MNLAFLTRYDARNIRKWSGTPYNMAKYFEKEGDILEYVGPLNKDIPFSYTLKRKLKKMIGGDRTKSTYLPSILHGYADQAKKILTRSNSDAVIAPVMETIAYLDCKQPKFIWTDAVFANLCAYYPNYYDLSHETIKSGNDMARSCLENVSLAFFSSDWAAFGAHSAYGIAKEKCRVVPFGANMDITHNEDDVREMIKSRGTDTVKLLFIGVEWHRKGGDIVLNVAKALHESGQKVQLTMVGAKPPKGTIVPEYVKATGFVSKHEPEGLKQIESLLRNSHFLFVPSRAEAYGVVFCEANAFGVPAISSCTGGIPTIIQRDINGFAMPLDTPTDTYCGIISDLMADAKAYEALALSSFREYKTRLNWAHATQTVQRMMAEVV